MDNITPIETPNVYMIRAYTDENSYFAFGLYVNAEDANKAAHELMEGGRYRKTEISNIPTDEWGEAAKEGVAILAGDRDAGVIVHKRLDDEC